MDFRGFKTLLASILLAFLITPSLAIEQHESLNPQSEIDPWEGPTSAYVSREFPESQLSNLASNLSDRLKTQIAALREIDPQDIDFNRVKWILQYFASMASDIRQKVFEKSLNAAKLYPEQVAKMKSLFAQQLVKGPVPEALAKAAADIPETKTSKRVSRPSLISFGSTAPMKVYVVPKTEPSRLSPSEGLFAK